MELFIRYKEEKFCMLTINIKSKNKKRTAILLQSYNERYYDLKFVVQTYSISCFFYSISGLALPLSDRTVKNSVTDRLVDDIRCKGFDRKISITDSNE